MLKKLVIAAAALAAMPAAAQQNAVVARENGLWRTVNDQRMSAFAAMLTPDFVAVYAGAVNDRNAEVAAMRQQHLRSYALSDFRIRQLDRDVTLVTYTVAARGRFEKTNISGTYRATSVWRRIGREWKLAFHSEIKAQ